MTKVDVVESADSHHRWAQAIQFGIDDRVVVGGSALPIDYDPGSDDSADLTLGLYTADGSINQSVEHPYFGWLGDLGVSGAGQIVTLTYHPFDVLVMSLTPELTYQWSLSEHWIDPEEHKFRGLAVDPTGSIYVTGSRVEPDPWTSSVLLLALDPSGSILWKTVEPSPTRSDAGGRHVFIDASGDVVVAGGEWGENNAPFTPIFARFDIDGTALEWASWTPDEHVQDLEVAAVLAAPDGGCFASLYSSGEESRSYLARFDGDGAPVWVREHEPEASTIHSLAYDPAGTLYGARSHEVCAFLP